MTEKDELKAELFERLETILDNADFNGDIETGDNAFYCIVLAKQLFGENPEEFAIGYASRNGMIAKTI